MKKAKLGFYFWIAIMLALGACGENSKSGVDVQAQQEQATEADSAARRMQLEEEAARDEARDDTSYSNGMN